MLHIRRNLAPGLQSASPTALTGCRIPVIRVACWEVSRKNPPLIHASGMAVRPRCLLTSHLRAYRIGTREMLLHLVWKGE